MERFLIQINGEGSYYDPMSQVFFLNEEEYADFNGMLKDLELIDGFNKSIHIRCELCSSFIISAKSFYLFIRKALDAMSRTSLLSDKYPGMDLLYNDLSIICSYLLGTNYTGLAGTDTAREDMDESVFAHDEIGLITNPVCACYSSIAQ